jgi:urease beta subunit
MIPGEYIFNKKNIVINVGKKIINIQVTNLGDRPIQIGSHFHFFEVNRYLQFERKLTIGYRLNIPSGTAVRFEPGESKNIQLVEFDGKQQLIGFNNLFNAIINQTNSKQAYNLMVQQKFANLSHETKNEL